MVINHAWVFPLICGITKSVITMVKHKNYCFMKCGCLDRIVSDYEFHNVRALRLSVKRTFFP